MRVGPVSRPSIGGLQPATPGEPARHFTDCVGTAWTVYEVHPADLRGRASYFFPHPERRSGWLLFESSDAERRRLAPFPGDWHSVSEFELERWCMRAARVEDLPKRRADD
jgi:hypothetical protein